MLGRSMSHGGQCRLWEVNVGEVNVVAPLIALLIVCQCERVKIKLAQHYHIKMSMRARQNPTCIVLPYQNVNASKTKSDLHSTTISKCQCEQDKIRPAQQYQIKMSMREQYDSAFLIPSPPICIQAKRNMPSLSIFHPRADAHIPISLPLSFSHRQDTL